MLIFTLHHRPAWSQAEFAVVEWLLEVVDGTPSTQPVVHEFADLASAEASIPKRLVRQVPAEGDEPSQIAAFL